MDEKELRQAFRQGYDKGFNAGKALTERAFRAAVIKARLFDLESKLEKAEDSNPYDQLTDQELLAMYRNGNDEAQAVASYTLSERYEGDGAKLKAILGGK